MHNKSRNSISRRSFVATAAAGMAALGSVGPIAPAAHAQVIEMASDWDLSEFKKLVHHPAQVKQVFDVTGGSGSGFDHIHNSFNGLLFGFGIPRDQLQIVAVMRGMATILIFDDHIWKKYQFGKLANVKDPKTGKPAERNIYYASKTHLKYTSDKVESPHSIYADTSMQALQHRGLRVIGCHNATWFMASYAAEKLNLKQPHKEIYNDMMAHLLPGVMIVAASVGALALLQSQGGYSYLYV